uniref:Variant surface glycoprotein 671 n=1 Tax=Trypanosoma brucei TaxID=5691 RepID=M4SYP2_9TRYP|nr:variant surface glycoprotein 671 [Trypanosoma brucei]
MLTIYLLALSFLAQAAMAAEAPTCSTNCGCAARLRRRLNTLRSKLDEAKAANAQNLKDFHKLLAAAASAEVTTKQLIIPILYAAGHRIAACSEGLGEAEAVHDAALKTTEQAAAAYSLQELIQQQTGETVITLENSAAKLGGSGYSAEGQILKLGDKGCSNSTAEDAETGDLTELTANGQKQTPQLITHVQLLGSCQRDGTESNDCHSSAIGANGKIKLAIKLTADAGAPIKQWPATNTKAGVVTTGKFDMTGKLASSAHNDLQQLAQKIQNLNCAASIRQYSAVATTPMYNLLLTKTTEGKENAEQGGELKATELKDVVRERYGDNGKDFTSKLWQTVDDSPAYLGKGQTEETTQLKKINTLAQVGETAARALVKQLKTQQSKTEKTTKTDSTTDSADKAEDKKNGDNEKTPATNTTGSNSLLIKASPLWLAFLLF